MSVYFRTGNNTGASFPWWFYLLVILPLQILVVIPLQLAWKALVLLVRLTAAAVAYFRARQRRAQHTAV